VRLRFDEYQERCLYDPDHGFYATSAGAGARGGDFLTSPEVGPLFGAVLARWLDGLWDELGSPGTFDVVEVGGGRGALAAAVLRAEPRCMEALRYVVVEQSAPLRARAAELLGDRAEVRDRMVGERLRGAVVANELLDNLPIRMVERRAGTWLEVHVDVDDRGAREALEPIVAEDVDRLVPAVVQAAADVVGDGRFPVEERAARWVAGALDRIEAGRLLCFDYGVATTAGLVEREWLRTYAGHARGNDPYEDPMGRDITVDVAVDQLPGAAVVRSQADFLREWGIDELVEEGRALWQERAHLGDLKALAARSRINEAAALTDPAGLGAFLAMEWTVPAQRAPVPTSPQSRE